MRVSDIILTPKQIFNNSADETALLLEIRKGYAYENGKATDKVDHHKYDVVIPQNKFDKITVKISGDALVTNEQIAQKGGSLKVKFKNLTGKFYRMSNGEYGLSATAEGIEVIA
ncbi:MAG: hypothetical protein HDQ97_17455 [Lachnospiraceae bacterium]|nr:hypothetical protein [Lachnospiraceae bacterium]